MGLKVFISYDNADQDLCKKLEEHLSVLEHSGKITIWQAQKILSGMDREDQINTHLKDADIILLLISASFISSNDHWNREVKVALERYNAGAARVIPIILKPALWQETPLKNLQVLPEEAKPVVKWKNREMAFHNVARGIQMIVDDLLGESDLSELQTVAPGAPPIVSSSQKALRPGLAPIKRQQPFQHQRIVRGGIVVLVVLLLTSGGFWLIHSINSTVTGQKRQPTMTGTPRQEHPIGIITEYPIPTSDTQADSITLGPDGNLWFTEDKTAKIGRITPKGSITEPVQLNAKSNPAVIVLGIDDNLWVLENGSTKIARVTPQGHITEFPITPGSNPVGLVAGKDGNIWFTEFQTNKIGRMNISGQITGEFPIPTSDSGAAGIAQGPDGNLWFDEQRGNQFGRITPKGQITGEFPYTTSPVSGTDNNHNLAAGPDGNVWFTDFWHNQIGKITPQGKITEYPLSTPNNVPTGITTGPDGNIWFTECVFNPIRNACENNSKIGRITPQGVITEYSLSTPNSSPAGITTGPDGNIWFTEDAGNKIGKITTGL